MLLSNCASKATFLNIHIKHVVINNAINVAKNNIIPSSLAVKIRSSSIFFLEMELMVRPANTIQTNVRPEMEGMLTNVEGNNKESSLYVIEIAINPLPILLKKFGNNKVAKYAGL